jgi:hypothetical protein
VWRIASRVSHQSRNRATVSMSTYRSTIRLPVMPHASPPLPDTVQGSRDVAGADTIVATVDSFDSADSFDSFIRTSRPLHSYLPISIQIY